IRGRGLFRAIELVARRDPDTPYEPGVQLHARIRQHALDRGLVCYPGGGTIDGRRGDHVLLAPPFITNRTELDAAIDVLGAAVDAAITEAEVAQASFVK